MSRLTLFFEKFAFVALPLVALAGCSSEKVANGVSEETNTVAGILIGNSGVAVAGVPVCARHFDNDDVVAYDTTDADGKFGFSLKVQGRYGVSAQEGEEAFYEIVEYAGDEVNLDAKLDSMGSVSGEMLLGSDSAVSGIRMFIPGSPWSAETNEEGRFEFKAVPAGVLPVFVESPNPEQFSDVVYVAKVNKSSAKFHGPVPPGHFDKFVNGASELAEIDSDAELQMPLSPEYGLRSLWTMDLLDNIGYSAKKLGDDRDWTEGILVYGVDSLEKGVVGNALALNGANQFGIVENDNGLFDGVKAFTLEAWINIGSVESGKYRKNIVGKFTLDSSKGDDVFSLALMKGECGAQDVSLAFFIGNGNRDSMSCGDAAIAEFDLFENWVYVTAVWDGKTSVLYVNGKKATEKHVSVKQIGNSSESIYFGKDDLNLKLDDVRLSTSAITASDVLFRYYLKGGAI